QPWRNLSAKACTDSQDPLHLVDRAAGSFRGHLRSQGLDHARVPELFQESGVRRLVDQRAYGGQG
ncbi:MAG TPA: hypothetical protein VNF91_00245, partial [Candidatus Acidoferrum sp.]|nr:hypothetical protein [Candidatus Acidoferrum sp.]